MTMRRVPELDALRGLAALGVLFCHLQPTHGWTQFGMTGVHLFLVLSGYLITRIVLAHGGTPGFLRSFYARRTLRTWPTYFLTLGALVLYQQSLPNPPSLDGLPYYLTFTQYLWQWPVLGQVLPQPTNGPVRYFEQSWTLAIEEQFYLLWPLAILALGRLRVVPLAAGAIGLGVWYKMLGHDSWTLPNVIGALALGGLIAAILRDPARVERARPLLSIGFVAAGLAGFGGVHWYYTVPPVGFTPTGMLWRDAFQNYSYYTLHFGIVGFVATNAGAMFLAPLRLREVTYLGEISYGLYLYHLPIYWIVNGSGAIQHDEPTSMWVCKIALSCLAASLSYRYIERPLLRFKEFFPYGEPAPVEARPAPAAIPQHHLVVGRESKPALVPDNQARISYGARPAAAPAAGPAATKSKATSPAAGGSAATKPASHFGPKGKKKSR